MAMTQDEFRNSPIMIEVGKLPRSEWISIDELITRVDPNDAHLEGKIHELVSQKYLDFEDGRVRWGHKLPKLKP